MSSKNANSKVEKSQKVSKKSNHPNFFKGSSKKVSKEKNGQNSKNHSVHNHGVLHHSHKSSQNLTTAIMLNVAFFVVEIICGNLFNSKLILADALHDLGDVLILSTSLIFDRISRKKPTAKFSYGFRRLVVFGAILNAAVLLIGSWQMARWLYFEIFFPHRHPFVNVPGLAIVSILGIVVNLVAAWRVYGSKSVLDQAVFVHLLEDLLGWVMGFLTAILIGFTGFHQLDQIVSTLILAIVAWGALANIWRILKILLQATPDEKALEKIRRRISKIQGVIKIENVHFWSLDGEHHVFSARIFVEDLKDSKGVREQVSKILANFEIIDSTIELLEK